LCGAIHQVIADLLPADKFYVALYDAAGNTISWPYFADDRQLPRVPEPLEEDSAIAQVIRSGRALLATRDNQRLDAGPVRAPSGTLGDWLGVPLVSGKDVMGAVVLENASQGEPYTDKHRELLQFVSTQVASAIERKQAQERLLHMANHDALTGLANRALFYDRLKMALHRARREAECLGLLYLDLDDLKTVNDSLGHQAGDRLLCELADRLVYCTRASDTVARMGGDEFTILLAGVSDASGIDVVIGKVRAALSAPLMLDGQEVSLSVSIGKALYPNDGELPDSLVRRADADMYEHKRRLRAG
jgi:diguanylate cyclase (GGDEF)-like protein